MDDELQSGKVWMIPVDGSSDSAEEEAGKSSGGHVWLVPDDYSVSETDFSAAKKGSSSEGVSPREEVEQTPSVSLSSRIESSLSSLFRPSSVDFQDAKEVGGRLFMGFVKKLRGRTAKQSEKAEQIQNKMQEDDEMSVSTSRLNEFSEQIFPDILTNLSAMGEDAKESPWEAKEPSASNKMTKHEKNTKRRQLWKTTSWFPDILAKPSEKVTVKDADTSQASPKSPITQSTNNTSVIGSSSDEDKQSVASSELEVLDSSSSGSDDSSTLPSPPSSKRMNASPPSSKRNKASSVPSPKLVNGVWLVPAENENTNAKSPPSTSTTSRPARNSKSLPPNQIASDAGNKPPGNSGLAPVELLQGGGYAHSSDARADSRRSRFVPMVIVLDIEEGSACKPIDVESISSRKKQPLVPTRSSDSMASSITDSNAPPRARLEI
jgi:hypothetical protein